jgi:hypothetical protein
MTADEIRKVSLEDAEALIDGTGTQDAYRNLMLGEIAAQLAELNANVKALRNVNVTKLPPSMTISA